jgi:spore maturation protein CgeB
MKKKNIEPLPEKSTVWSLVEQGNFNAIIDGLQKAGIDENNLGQTLYNFIDKALEDKEFHIAISILEFIIDSLEDKSEVPPLLKKIGDIYILLADPVKAREYYGKLPITLKNIRFCCETFIPSLDLDGVIGLRNTLLSKVNDASSKNEIHAIVNEAILNIYKNPLVFTHHIDLADKNRTVLEKIYPFSQDFKKYRHYFSIDPENIKEPGIIRYSDNIYVNRNNVWAKLFSPDQIKTLPEKKIDFHTDRIACCDSPESFFMLMNRLKTNNPSHIKHEFWVITDFKLLGSIIQVLDLSVLNNCNFVIRFIDIHDLKSQLIHLVHERKLMIDKAVYLSKGHHDFFLTQVRPTLKECERKMEHQIRLYEKKLSINVRDNSPRKIFQKIKTGQKLRIFLLTSRFTTYLQYSTRDMAQGFRHLGHETLIEIEDEDSGLGIRKDVTMENIIHFQPDLIFAIDHLRYSRPWIPENIPFVSWIQDLMPHLIGLSDPKLIGEHDHIFSFSQHWIDHFFKQHPVLKNEKIHLLPITCDHKIYYPLPGIEKKYDISYVTHIPDPAHTLLPLLQGDTLPEVNSQSAHAFLTQLASDLNDISMEDLFGIQNDIKTKKSLAVSICNKINLPFQETFLQFLEEHTPNNQKSRFIWHIFYLLKTKPIKYLLENGIAVRVFGHNWEKIPIFQEIAMGSVGNGADLNKVYNESRINLNISPETTYHMKAPEVIAGNNFMMTRHIPPAYDIMPIDTFFDIDKEIVLFQNEKELLEKVRFFLAHPDKRNQIADAGYTKYLTTLTIDKSAVRILDAMAAGLPRID